MSETIKVQVGVSDEELRKWAEWHVEHNNHGVAAILYAALGQFDSIGDTLLRTQAELEKLREGDWAKLSRNLHNAEVGRDNLRATVERVQEANERVHAHRFDLDSADDAAHDAWLESLGERRVGGPDAFYNGVEFAHRRIRRALDGDA
ncbi:hypothetical protein [Gordonia sp. SND2]|uniref:hypothetical protein n=1 Tax=Gordonia sp. SND2 TaxID=3388659 RepID=UPI00398AAC19